jgi:peptidoglycan hydrolase CwlO-like protein
MDSMKRIGLIISITITTLLSVFLLVSYNSKKVSAEAQCPAGMTLLECYEYYKKQEDDLHKQEQNLTKKLKNEEYQQLSLNEKIKYIQRQIAQNETLIKELQIEIAKQDIEIQILKKEIEKKEDNISLLKQEVNVLGVTVNNRITESYKFSFINQFEIFLDIKNISSILRRSKYLTTTRSKDLKALERYSSSIVELEVEEAKLLDDKKEMEVKKSEIEEERKKLEEVKAELDGQKNEQANLLAQSKRREATYLAELKQISTALSESEKATADLIIRLAEQGYFKNGRRVAKGEVIGLQGHTGCSFGSHLHYLLRNSRNVILEPSSGGYLGGTGYGQYVTSGLYTAPLVSGLVTNDFWGGHNAIDMVSKAQGNQSWDTYIVPYGLCPIVDNILNTRKNMGLSNWNVAYLNGEGARVYASTSGVVNYYVDQYGATWAYLQHDDGNKTLYVHLQAL